MDRLELTAGPYRIDVHLPMPADVLGDVLTSLGRAGFALPRTPAPEPAPEPAGPDPTGG